MTLEDLILFIDAEAIVIDKPTGLAVDAPRAGGDSIERRIGELSLGFARPPAVMHRLDRDTSGCLLFARNRKSRASFQQAFESGLVQKTYIAVVAGELADAEGVIDLALAKVSTAETGWRMVADDSGKHAITRWRRIAARDGQSLVEFRPETGRTHQIRVHAARGLGAAIVGDPVYGEPGNAGMLLHASQLIVPRAPKPAVDVTAPLPDRFGLWLDAFDG